MKSHILLAGDIGGTKTNLAIFSSEIGTEKPLRDETFLSKDFNSLEEIIDKFLFQINLNIDTAVFGVAGPVIDGKAKITNLPWIIDESLLKKRFNLSSVKLINDLQSIGYAIPFLKSDDLYILKKGESVSGGVIAVIAPGTGLGDAFLTWNGSRYQVHASEGGHTDFAPSNPTEAALLNYLQYRYDHVSYEHICSGQGIPNIYNFLKDTYHFEEPDWLAEQIAITHDPVPHIIKAALDKEKTCEISVITMNIFTSILGAEAGNLALKTLAAGGVYLGGGIPPRILPILQNGHFMGGFRRKGRMSDLLARIPVYIILNPNSALFGAAQYSFNYRNPE